MALFGVPWRVLGMTSADLIVMVCLSLVVYFFTKWGARLGWNATGPSGATSAVDWEPTGDKPDTQQLVPVNKAKSYRNYCLLIIIICAVPVALWWDSDWLWQSPTWDHDGTVSDAWIGHFLCAIISVCVLLFIEMAIRSADLD